MIEDLADELGQEQYIFIFQGHHHVISSGPFHYLLADDGQRVPLFEVPSAEEAQPSDGYVGTELPYDDPQPDDETAEYEHEVEYEEDEEQEEDPFSGEPELQVHQPDDDDDSD